MGSVETVTFNPTQFLEDIKTSAAAIDAHFSADATLKVLDIYGDVFKDAAIIWRATSRPGDALNYRVFPLQRFDFLTRAIKHGLVEESNPMVALLKTWGSLWEGTPEQLCDFDASKGLVKMWLYVGGVRPMADVLNAPGVSEEMRQNIPRLHGLGLERGIHVAVDFHSHTINLYHHTKGPLTRERLAELVALAKCPPPPEEDFLLLAGQLQDSVYNFAITMQYPTGNIARVAFYALKRPGVELPPLDERLTAFEAKTPTYDGKQQFRCLSWSYGAGGKKYVKFENSYCGNTLALIEGWGDNV